MTGVEVSAVIPVFNDREALKRAIPLSITRLSEVAPCFELIIAEDGSTDGSADLVRSWEEQDSRVRLFHSDERLGRGRALNRARFLVSAASQTKPAAISSAHRSMLNSTQSPSRALRSRWSPVSAP